MNVKIKFSSNEISILREIFDDSFNGLFQIDKGYILIDEQDLEGIIDNVSDYFISKGLDRKDEPTRFGLEIENIQGKLLNLLWSLET